MTQPIPDVEALIRRLAVREQEHRGFFGSAKDYDLFAEAAQALRIQDGLLREALEAVRPFAGVSQELAALYEEPDVRARLAEHYVGLSLSEENFRRAAAFSEKLSAKDAPSTPQVSTTPHSAGSGSEGAE